MLRRMEFAACLLASCAAYCMGLDMLGALFGGMAGACLFTWQPGPSAAQAAEQRRYDQWVEQVGRNGQVHDNAEMPF